MTRQQRWRGLMLVAVGVMSGCGGSPPSETGGGTVRVNGAGATFPYPLYSRWISDYHAVAPQVQINYESIGSGGGLQRLQHRTVDFGASDAPLSDAELNAMPAPVLHIPTVAGAVTVVYNLPEVRAPLQLDGPTLAGIFLGRITHWNDPSITALNPGLMLPHLPIVVSHRSDGSGTSYLFTTYLAAVSPEWKFRVGAGKSVQWPAGIGAKGNEGVSGNVKQTPGALGYVELAYAQQNKFPTARLKNAAGNFVAPTVESTTAAGAGVAAQMQQDIRTSMVNSSAPQAYPISGFTYLLVYQEQSDQGKGEALAHFLLWAIDQGQQHVASLGYTPLPPEVVDLNRTAIHSMTFGGKSLVEQSR